MAIDRATLGWAGSPLASAPLTRLAQATVAVVGAGGLGGPATFQLAALGVGRIRLIDDDLVDLSNLHRQLLFRPGDIGQSKAVIARRKVRAAFPRTAIDAVVQRLDRQNAENLLHGCAVVIDGTDNAESKFDINDCLVRAGIPFVHAGVTGFQAQVLTVIPGSGGACLRCVFPSLPTDDGPACGIAGVIGPLPGALGIIIATEACKIIRREGVPLTDRMLVCDAARGVWRTVRVTANPFCPACGDPAVTAPR